MDIRLKNNHKWGVLLIIFLILAVSVATVGLYPYMQKKTAEYRRDWSEAEADHETQAGIWKCGGSGMNFSYESGTRNARRRKDGF